MTFEYFGLGMARARIGAVRRLPQRARSALAVVEGEMQPTFGGSRPVCKRGTNSLTNRMAKR
ncbi:hypothetical protein KCP71_15395 [Salmonella enterica subsp. enterica]|nr:hypothetical protein KCP71_15395 [Salmonella enterica subsp. enterica]